MAKQHSTIYQQLQSHGISRRGFLKFCATTASMLALPPTAATAMAEVLSAAPRPSVIWLSFQECTGCTEAITRADSPTLETLIFDLISLDYHHTLQAASGHAAERAREAAMAAHHGNYLLVVDGSVPTIEHYSTIAGISNLQMLKESAAGAAAVINIGSCAAFGGLPHAHPNPTGAVPIADLITDKPMVNIPGCPPIPVVMTAVLAHYITFGRLPELDALYRPKAFYGETIHDRCYRRPYYDQGKFAKTFDDDGARNGWCLFELGCKGPTTYNACATTKWNQGTSFPIQSGHGCIGCSEPDFWDAGSFYQALSVPIRPPYEAATVAAAGAAIGTVVGGATLLANRYKRAVAKREQPSVSVDDLTR